MHLLRRSGPWRRRPPEPEKLDPPWCSKLLLFKISAVVSSLRLSYYIHLCCHQRLLFPVGELPVGFPVDTDLEWRAVGDVVQLHVIQIDLLIDSEELSWHHPPLLRCAELTLLLRDSSCIPKAS